MTRLTTTDVENAISTLLIEGEPITTINVRAVLGSGSFSSIQKILRGLGYLKETAKTESVTEREPVTQELENTDHKQISNRQEIERLIYDKQQELERLRRKEANLEALTTKIENEFSEPFHNATAVLEYYLKMTLDSDLATEIPGDLKILLKKFRDQPEFELIKDENSSYEDDAAKIVRAILLNKELY